MTAPMDMTVSTTVVATAGATLHVTNRLVTVTGDVNLDIRMFSVATVIIVKSIKLLRKRKKNYI